MSLYDFWVNADGKIFKIFEMDDEYILNCIKEIKRVGKSFSRFTFEDLSANDLKLYSQPTNLAWYVINGEEYKKAFNTELLSRGITDSSI